MLVVLLWSMAVWWTRLKHRQQKWWIQAKRPWTVSSNHDYMPHSLITRKSTTCAPVPHSNQYRIKRCVCSVVTQWEKGNKKQKFSWWGKFDTTNSLEMLVGFCSAHGLCKHALKISNIEQVKHKSTIWLRNLRRIWWQLENRCILMSVWNWLLISDS